MKKWTEKDIQNLKLKNNLTKKKPKNNVLNQKCIVNGKISIEKEGIKTVLWVLKREGIIPDYVEELEFHTERKFRFDWAIPELMIAIEYEGLFSKKSGHTTVGGYTKDTIKYNLAAINGWTVLRYTALSYQNLEKDIKLFISLKNKTA